MRDNLTEVRERAEQCQIIAEMFAEIGEVEHAAEWRAFADHHWDYWLAGRFAVAKAQYEGNSAEAKEAA